MSALPFSVPSTLEPSKWTPAKPAAPFYRPELDVVRFVAFMGVFLSHGYVSRARAWIMLADTFRFGVCLFFLLSAYLITELLRRERGRTGSLHLKKFYVRRILRIWPLYFFGLAISVGLGVPGLAR